MAQAWLQDCRGARQMGGMLGRLPGLGHGEIVLRERYDKVSIVVQPQAVDGPARPKAPGGVILER
jgi:hypothetical protein